MSDEELRAPSGLKLGATGEFPDGKVCEQDEGQLQFALRAFPEKGIVAVDFGKRVSWLGLDKALAIRLGQALISEAEKLS